MSSENESPVHDHEHEHDHSDLCLENELRHDHEHSHDERNIEDHGLFDHVHDHSSTCRDTAASVIQTQDHGHDHGHSHEKLKSAGYYATRPRQKKRKYAKRAFCVGIGGPVGSGKTALMLALCLKLRQSYNICAVTNDIFTREDGEFLVRHQALSEDRISAVETGGCPHAAIREDITANLLACEDLTEKHGCDIILLESGGDNLAADFSRELADFTVYVIDTAGGDKVPRKGGPGITQSDLLVVNKTDLAEAVGASIAVMDRDAKLMRGDGPTVFAQVKHGPGVDEILGHILAAHAQAVEENKEQLGGDTCSSADTHKRQRE